MAASMFFGLGLLFGLFNPFNPKLKKYNILPTFSREMYKWGSEN